MILSDNRIRELIKTDTLVTPFLEDRLQGASYDISSSDTIIVYQSVGASIDLRFQENVKKATQKFNMTEGYHIKPNEYVLVKTAEKFNVPNNLAAHIRPRTTFTKLGLISVGQHLNPNFSGYLYIGIKNVTPNIIDIYPNLKIAQIVFEEIAGAVSEEKLYNNKKDAKYQNEDDFISPAYDRLSEDDKKKVDKMVNKFLGYADA